jgi:2-desacetyl-2-hydroxyethyl bacteriochlorophyllide A dehydrogenase
MKVALLHKPYDIRIEEREEPKVGPEDVLVEEVHTGICGSDVNRYMGLRGSGEPVYPAILGHEFGGRVKKVGEKVKGFQAGDRIIGTAHESLCQYFLLPQTALLKLPEEVSLEESQSIGPLGGTLHATNLGGIQIGDVVVVLGPGHAGLIMVQWAKIAGADQVVLSGTRENRLQVGKKLGADFTINTREEDPVKRVKEITGGAGADVVIEATGRPDAVKQAIDMVKTEGNIVIFGVGQEAIDGFDIYAIYQRKIKIIGARGRTEREKKAALKYLVSGKVSVKPIITHVFPLEEAQKAFEVADKRLDNAIRIVIKS